MIPDPSNGFYTKTAPTAAAAANVTESTEFADGDVVTVTCHPGFNMKGPSRMQCDKGEWDVGAAIAECTPGDY